MEKKERQKVESIYIGKPLPDPVRVIIRSGKYMNGNKQSRFVVQYLTHAEVCDTVAGALRAALQKRGLA